MYVCDVSCKTANCISSENPVTKVQSSAKGMCQWFRPPTLKSPCTLTPCLRVVLSNLRTCTNIHDELICTNVIPAVSLTWRYRNYRPVCIVATRGNIGFSYTGGTQQSFKCNMFFNLHWCKQFLVSGPFSWLWPKTFNIWKEFVEKCDKNDALLRT